MQIVVKYIFFTNSVEKKNFTKLKMENEEYFEFV